MTGMESEESDCEDESNDYSKNELDDYFKSNGKNVTNILIEQKKSKKIEQSLKKV